MESGLQGLPQAVAAQVTNLNAAGQTFKTAGQIVTDTSRALQQVAQPVQQAAISLQAGVVRVEQAVTQAKEIQQQTGQTVQGALDKLTQAANAAERTFKTHEGRFGEADERLARTLTVLRDGVEQVVKTSQEVFKGYDQHISKAVGSLGSVAEDFKEMAETLDESIKQLVETRQPPPRRF